jgi:hypothetical protein
MTLLAVLMLGLLTQGFIPLWGAIAALVAWWLITLPGNTWFGYAAAMTYDRVRHGCMVVLPAEDERANEPDVDRLVRYQLWFPAAFKNYVLSKLVCIFYFGRWPRWGKEGGLTMTLNRLVAEETGWRYDRARAIQKRFLDRYDRRSKHT